LSPQGVLKRGYSITTLKKSGAVVRNAANLKPGDRLVSRLAEGSVDSVIEDAAQLRFFD
jgi:exodeoxyribonuclease VII large subunit